MIKQAKIVKLKNKWQVQSESGKNLGTYDSRAAAEKRLKQVEFFKRKKSLKDIYDFIKKSEDTNSYSSCMRDLNKKDPDKIKPFMTKFKDAFDRAMNEELEDHQMLALMEAKKCLDI